MYSRREIGVALKILDEVTSADYLQTGNYPDGKNRAGFATSSGCDRIAFA
jgi:hypothetical protein